MALLAVMVWIALIIQFYISSVKFLADGRTLGGGLVQLWSYFTIQNNLLVALAMTVPLLWPASKPGKLLAKPSILTAFAVYITVVGLVYQIILRPQVTQYGWFAFCDEILHSLCPPMFILYWLIFVDKLKMPWRLALNWLSYPFIYCIYILIRGGISGYYPYSFIDGNKLSYPQIFINCVFLLILFLGLGIILIAIKRHWSKTPAAAIIPLA